jgi:hypothetical protein
VNVALSLEELDLIQRGLSRLLGEVHPAEPVAGLCARLRLTASRAPGIDHREATRDAHQLQQEPAR